MIDHNDVEPGIGRVFQGREGGCAAIDGDHQRYALILQLHQRRRVGAVAFSDAVGHIDRHVAPDGREKPGQQRAGTRAVDIVIGEHANLLAVIDCRDDARHGAFHTKQMRWIGQQVAQLGIQERVGGVGVDPARRQDAAQHIGNAEPLRDRQGATLVGQPRAPPFAAQRLFDVQE